MRFDTIADGSTRVYDGPFYGVRLLSAGSGAACVVDNLALPTSVLPAFKTLIRQIVLTGPAVIAIADSEYEDISQFTASPLPVTATNPGALIGSGTLTSGMNSAPSYPSQLPIPQGTIGLVLCVQTTAYNATSNLLALFGIPGAVSYLLSTAPTSAQNLGYGGNGVMTLVAGTASAPTLKSVELATNNMGTPYSALGAAYYSRHNWPGRFPPLLALAWTDDTNSNASAFAWQAWAL